MLVQLLETQQKWAAAHVEHGLTLASLGRGGEAIKALQKTVELQPNHPDAWRHLADHLLATNERPFL